MDAGGTKKVLMLTLFPSEGNGSATVVRDLATALAPDTEVAIFYIAREEQQIDGPFGTHTLVLDDFPVLRTHPQSVAQKKYVQLTEAEIDAYVKKVHDAVRAVVDAFQPDVIHVHHGWLGATVAKQIQQETGIPYVVQFHGTELEVRADYEAHDGERMASLDRLVHEGLSGAACFVAISPTEEEKTAAFAASTGLDVPLRMIPNGYDESIFRLHKPDFDAMNAKHADALGGATLDPARPIVLYVGRFAGFKGIEHLVRAIPGYEETGAQTLLCGGGELREPMEALAKELDAKDTWFLGHVDHFDDLPALYAAADVLVVPSRGEPFGLVAIEAMGCGAPVIAADSGALPYILGSSSEDQDRDTFRTTSIGLIVPFGDPHAIADAVTYSIENCLRDEHGSRISAQVNREFSVNAQTERYRDLYDAVRTQSTSA